MHRIGDGTVGLQQQRLGAARGAELDPPARSLYHWIVEEMAAGRTLRARDLRDATLRFGADGATALQHMASLDLVQLDDAGAVRCAYPFSASATGHAVQLSGGQLTVEAMCAVDALGIPYMLRRAGEIASADPGTGSVIRVVIEPPADPASQPPSVVVVVGAATSATSCSASELACPYISFFESEQGAQSYLEHHPEITGTVLSLHDATALGRAIFEDLLTG